jgi:hypothetical protein
MAYLLQPVNTRYDPEEPMPTPLGFITSTGIFMGTTKLKWQFMPIPRDTVHKTIDVLSDVPIPDFLKDPGDVDGDRPMPDFFFLAADHYYVSSRLRSVLERYAHDAVEYIEVKFNMPESKNPADAYYFINVLGRGQLVDWDASNKSGPSRTSDNKRSYVRNWPPDQWAMRPPPPGHPAIWHEVDKEVDDIVYRGSGTQVFVTRELGDALKTGFPGQVRLYSIRELA